MAVADLCLEGWSSRRNGSWYVEILPRLLSFNLDQLTLSPYPLGISGNKEHGCLSVIVSNGYSQDRDEGDRVFYCGTLGTLTPSDEPFNPEERVTSPGVASANTNLLLTSMEKETPIRLLRSHKGRSEYAPSDGIRYDGLYKVKAYEILDVAYAMHRFTLEREPGQPEIRYRGPGARPNDVELGERGWGGVKNTMKGERH